MQGRINLLAPSTNIKVKSAPEAPSKLLIGLCLLGIVLTLAANGTLFMLNRTGSAKLNDLKSQIEGFKAVEREANAQAKTVQEFNRMSQSVQQLSAARPRLSKHLARLLSNIPAAINLSSLQIQGDPAQISIQGTAPSQLEVSEFGRNLQESSYYKDSLINSSTMNVGVGAAVQFSFTITPGNGGGNN